MTKKHSRTVHIGNQGEHIVASVLGKNCIVRDVGQGKDTGIDLYAEVMNDENYELSLHFFCQVKTVKGKYSKRKIEDKYFKYWGNQPVPVFLFCVEYEEENNIQDTHELWVYDIPYILAKRDAAEFNLPEPNRDMLEKFKLGDVSNNKDEMSVHDFLYGHLPWSYGLWQLRKYGLVLPNPEIKSDREPILVGGFSYLYKNKVRKSIEFAESLLNRENTEK
jgi:hypothetical protein